VNSNGSHLRYLSIAFAMVWSCMFDVPS
jgi:hypothetical protein